jgi:CheY-like chemotaxis protein
MSRKLRAIILEDDEALKELLGEILSLRGYDIHAFDNPAICPLQLAPECKCHENERCADILLSDINMPFITGLEFIRNQKDKGCKIPYIALLSGDWGAERLSEAENLGCKTFSKPFKLEEIKGWLDEVEKNIDLSTELLDWFNDS